MKLYENEIFLASNEEKIDNYNLCINFLTIFAHAYISYYREMVKSINQYLLIKGLCILGFRFTSASYGKVLGGTERQWYGKTASDFNTRNVRR